jgi:hypothetical protein
MEDLQECNKKQFGTLHRAFSCLLAGSDALDILTGEELDWRTLESGARPEIGLAPLYARDQTTADGRPAHLLTLAMVLAGRTSSRKIASTSFEDMEEIGLLSQLVPSNISDTTPVDRLVRDRYRLVLQRLGQIFGRDVRVLRRED